MGNPTLARPMALKEESIRLIFGLKVRQLRAAAGLSLTELADRTGLSVSYVNEIEKGKKYPKPEKIGQLAEVLGVSFDKLVSLKVDKTLAPVLDILEGELLTEIPLELFGIDKGKIIEIVANSPAKVSAFISALAHMAATSNVTGEHFYFAALRSYQELHENHFEDLERSAAQFVSQYGLPAGTGTTSAHLSAILTAQFGYVVREVPFDSRPEIGHLRSVFIPEGKKLLINSRLAENQKAFLCAKELGHAYLGLAGQRMLTTPWPRATSFDQVLNNSRASYFAGAVLIPPAGLVAGAEQWFSEREFRPDALLGLMAAYNSSPEMFAVRLTNLLPRHFGLQTLFFQRFDHDRGSGQVTLGKELHLARNRDVRGVAALNSSVGEWCRRDVFPTVSAAGPVAAAQIFNDGGRRYLVWAVARQMGRETHRCLAVCIGFELNAATLRKVSFGQDRNIGTSVVSIPAATAQREADFAKVEAALRQLVEAERSA